MAGLGNGKVSQFHSAVAGEYCSKHCVIHIIHKAVVGLRWEAFLDEALQKAICCKSVQNQAQKAVGLKSQGLPFAESSLSIALTFSADEPAGSNSDASQASTTDLATSGTDNARPHGNYLRIVGLRRPFGGIRVMG
jgi:hypothetical protein